MEGNRKKLGWGGGRWARRIRELIQKKQPVFFSIGVAKVRRKNISNSITTIITTRKSPDWKLSLKRHTDAQKRDNKFPEERTTNQQNRLWLLNRNTTS